MTQHFNRWQPELLPETELTFENFWQKWGVKSELDRSVLEELWVFAESQYGDLPAHNFTHAKDTLWKSMEYTDLCEENSLIVNRKLLVGTSLLHDAAFHEPLENSGFATREDRSASIWANEAGRFGYTPDEIAEGKRNILATDHNNQPLTIEDKILVRADISNLSGNYIRTFRARTSQFIDEARLLQGDNFNHAQFVANSIHVLLSSMAHDLSFGNFDRRWSKYPMLNLKRLARSYAVREGISFTRYVHHLGGTAADKLLDKPLAKIKHQRTETEQEKPAPPKTPDESDEPDKVNSKDQAAA